jgi:hypothetical protein
MSHFQRIVELDRERELREFQRICTPVVGQGWWSRVKGFLGRILK